MGLFCFSADVFLVLLAILFPPLPVWIKRGICSADSLINIALCMLGFIPGLLHSWYIIARFPEEPFFDPNDLEAQEFVRHNGHNPNVVYTRTEFVYSPIPQTDGAAIRPAGSPAPAAPQESAPVPSTAPSLVQQDPLSDIAGPSSNEAVPPPYQEYEGMAVKDNKIQRDDNQ
ncbi:uncharacterized protein V2V93DRAFT_120636 [Kockiozyma suomiensis]|uniref:uncharacterized protein n=1 Tax=Kockiozyma suomiensis TaxID=1337062 RepID=UPI00334304FA